MSASFECAECSIRQKRIDELEDALAETFGKVAEIFGQLTGEVEKYLPERADYFKGCIATLNKLVADHEKEKLEKHEAKH